MLEENAKEMNETKTQNQGNWKFHLIQQENVNTRQQRYNRNVISLNCFNEVKWKIVV